MNRLEIAQEILRDCSAESLNDHKVIAEAIKRGDSIDKILNMAEIDRNPETYVWVKNILG